MPKSRLLLLAASAVLAAACTSTGAPPSTPASQDPGSSPAPTAAPSHGIEHPTGAEDIVLRLEEGGGFVPAEFAATNVPFFTLYGDGTVIFRKLDDFPMPPEDGGPTIYAPLRAAKLTPEQIQELLEFAITEGGLGVAKAEYRNDMVADAGTTTFTISANGTTKTVSAYALGMDAEPNPDSQVKAALVKLAERLHDFDQQGTLPSAEYAPIGFTGILFESGGGFGNPQGWPWADITPADFVADNGPDATLTFPKRSMTAEELNALGLAEVKGAVSGIQLNGPDGKIYSFALRPQLPGDDA